MFNLNEILGSTEGVITLLVAVVSFIGLVFKVIWDNKTSSNNFSKSNTEILLNIQKAYETFVDENNRNYERVAQEIEDLRRVNDRLRKEHKELVGKYNTLKLELNDWKEKYNRLKYEFDNYRNNGRS